ncbi:Bromodomain-containing protein [Scheffersomyces amazonensis]|uniref:Bromodomain-containing protein n=1 Tax=Scheffersomyces amazonensis TaxID=1078765 RepID=UPI00315C5301
MAPKRRTSTNNTPVKKQKVEVPSPEEFKQFYSSTINLVLNINDDKTNEQLSGPFVKLPSKKLYPDYYQLIEHPIAISDIQKKASRGKYSDNSADEFLSDFKLLLDNAIKYNDPESWIVTSAQRIYDFVHDQVKEFDVGKPHHKSLKLKLKHSDIPQEEVTLTNLPTLCKNIVNTIVNHEFPDDGILSGPFMDDVDTEEYPDYLKFVTNPTSFNSVLNHLDNKKFFSPKASILDNLQKFYDAVDLIFLNAQAYNDPSSEIYQDTLKLKDLFVEQFEELKSRVEHDSKSSTKLKLKLAPSKPKLKIKLAATAETEEVEDTKKKSRKRSKQSVKEEIEEENGNLEDEEDTANTSTNKEPEVQQSTETKPKAEIVTEKGTANTLGKSLPSIPESDCIIQESAILSSPSVAATLPQHIQQRYNQLNIPLSRQQDLKKALFPTHPVIPTGSVIEYRVPSNGYAQQSYSFSLAPEISPYVSFRVGLHYLLYAIKKDDLINGHGYLNSTSDEDFQCKLYVNNEEVSNGGDCFEDKRDDANLLGLSYDIKLNYGLNVINFECKVAPALSKQIKKSIANDAAEESGGRHTRHQLQQLKMSWDVETISFYIICNAV